MVQAPLSPPMTLGLLRKSLKQTLTGSTFMKSAAKITETLAVGLSSSSIFL